MEEKNNVAILEVIFYVLYSFIRFIISRFLFIMPFSFCMCTLYYDYDYFIIIMTIYDDAMMMIIIFFFYKQDKWMKRNNRNIQNIKKIHTCFVLFCMMPARVFLLLLFYVVGKICIILFCFSTWPMAVSVSLTCAAGTYNKYKATQ